MIDIGVLQGTLDDFNKATSRLQEAYENLEKKFDALNHELEKKNRELEKTLLEKEVMRNFLENVLNNLTTGVIVTDMDRRVQEMNRCAEAIFGEDAFRIKGSIIDGLFGHRAGESLQRFFDRVFRSREAGLRFRTNGKVLELSGTFLRGADGTSRGKIFLIRDVTRLEKLEEMLKRNEKISAMAELAANFAHEIRNPLGSMELFCSMLLKDLKSERDLDRVGFIIRSVRRMNRKITDLLSFTESVRTPDIETLNVHDIIGEVNGFVRQIARSEDISVRVRLECREPVIEGNREMLKHVFLNLFLNAIQAIEDRGRIEIETRNGELLLKEEGTRAAVEIRFSDNGIGIPPEAREKIFDPLFSTKETGSGLGLAFVHRIIQMHKGLIHVESGEPGKTVFSVLLPLERSDAAEEE